MNSSVLKGEKEILDDKVDTPSSTGVFWSVVLSSMRW